MIHEFKAQISETGDGTMTARLVPFGVQVPYGRGSVEFAAGSLIYPDAVPLTIDHADGVMARVGLMTRWFEAADGAYAEFALADTAQGRDLRELLMLGAVTDVSVGVAYDGDPTGVMTGTLDHVSVVDRGRFSSDDKAPAKVLSVHDVKEPPVADELKEAAAPVVAEYDDAEIRGAVAEMADRIEQLTAPAPAPVAEFSGREVFGALVAQRLGMPIANHALADVVGDLGAADASGLTPDYYWANGLQQNADRRRPMFAASGAAMFPEYGNNLTSAKVTQEVAVAARSAQKAAATSQALQVGSVTYPIVWFDGAVDVALELISQSNPDVNTVITDSLLRAYAGATETDIATKAKAAGFHTGAALPVDTYANFVAAAIETSNTIEDVTGLPGDRLAVSPADWASILGLMDGGDRRQFAVSSPQNSDGSGALTTRGIDIGGIFVFRSPAVVSAIQYNDTSLRTAERSPMDVVAMNVELMGQDRGILGATVVVHWDEGIASYEV